MFTNIERKILLILAFVQFNHIVDFMIIMPLGPQLMRTFDISPREFSLLVSSYTFFAGLSGFLATFYTDKFDRKKSLLFLFLGFTIATALCGLANTYETMLVTRALTGFFGGVMNSVVLSIVSDLIEYQRRGTAMGYLATAFSVASIVGVPFSLYLAHHFNYHSPFIFLAFICFLVLFAAYKYVPSVNHHLKNKNNAQHFWDPVVLIFKSKTQVTALVFMFYVMFSHFCIIPFISPTFVANAGISESDLTWIYLVGGFCSIFTAPFVGRLADRFGKSKIFIGSVLFSIVPILFVTHLEKTPLYAVLVVSGLFFISAGSRMIPAQALISSAVVPENRGAFMSLLSCIQSLSMALGAYVAGRIIVKDETTGYLHHYPIVGYVAIAIGILTIIIVQKIKFLDENPNKVKYPETEKVKYRL